MPSRLPSPSLPSGTGIRSDQEIASFRREGRSATDAGRTRPACRTAAGLSQPGRQALDWTDARTMACTRDAQGLREGAGKGRAHRKNLIGPGFFGRQLFLPLVSQTNGHDAQVLAIPHLSKLQHGLSSSGNSHDRLDDSSGGFAPCGQFFRNFRQGAAMGYPGKRVDLALFHRADDRREVLGKGVPTR